MTKLYVSRNETTITAQPVKKDTTSTATNTVKILGIDPGRTTGYANITVTDRKISLGEFGLTYNMDLLAIKDHIINADVIVYESFYVRPDMAMSGKFNWQEMPALQVIGSLMTLCSLYQKSTVVKQQPSQRVPGYAFAGLNYKQKAKGKHWQDALAHACFYAVKNLHAVPVGVSANASGNVNKADGLPD